KANNFTKVLSWADKVEEYAKEATPTQKAQIYSWGMDSAQKTNNGPQTIAYGEKVLTILPEDLNALISVASTLSVASPQDKAAQDKAVNYATKGLAVLGKLNPADLGLSEADWAKQKPGIAGTLHSTIGS